MGLDSASKHKVSQKVSKVIGAISGRQDREVRDRCDRPGLISELLPCYLDR